MSAESRRWLVYAQENLRAATMCLEGNLFNIGSVLPNFEPDLDMARRCLTIATHVVSVATGRFA